jgi:hypothetical protein
MENGCRQSQFAFDDNRGIRCRWAEVCHSWGKEGIIALVDFQDTQGKGKHLLSHSQDIGAGKKSQLPAQIICLSEANPLLRIVFPACAGMKFSTKNRLIDVYFTIPDLYIVTTIRMGTHPSLVVDWRPLTTKVRQRH